MLSKSKITYIRSLQEKSVRQHEGIFVVEGRKCMGEFLDSDFDIVEGFFTEKFASTLIKGAHFGQIEYSIITDHELERISTLTSNDSGILLVKMRISAVPKVHLKDLILVLDHINDPGNLGTIIRIADWYGISHIIASYDTVDCYNSKVIMATMGSLTRVQVYYTHLESFLSGVRDTKIYGAYLDGESIHTKKFTPEGGYLIIGSEAHGISTEIEKYITNRITIPRFGSAESLNAGVATGILVDRMIEKIKNF